MCLAGNELEGTEQLQFRDFCRLLQSVYHFEYHRSLESLKDSYAPLNPDRDTRKVGIFKTGESASFVSHLEGLLNNANYEKLSSEDLDKAFEEASLFAVRLNVDFSAFEDLLIFTRGESTRTEKVKKLFFFEKEITFSNYDRVVLYVRYKSEDDGKRRKHKPGSTLLKMFQNVPKADIEMLFPETTVGMRLIDKLMIGVPALLGAGAILTTQLGTSLILLGTLIGFWAGLHTTAVELNEATLLALFAGLGGLGSYIWKQFVNFKSRKLSFLQALTENLYFRNLDNNAGVFHRLVDDAEEEECKEAILAYYFLLIRPELKTVLALDQAIEAWFHARWDSVVDFEVDDALNKLIELGLLKKDQDNLEAVPLSEACRLLDHRWDEYFDFHKPAALNMPA